MIAENFLQVKDRLQTLILQSPENMKQEKCQYTHTHFQRRYIQNGEREEKENLERS